METNQKIIVSKIFKELISNCKSTILAKQDLSFSITPINKYIPFWKRAQAKHSWHCINNNDGTIRWIFPTSCRKPHFLQSYSAHSTKAKIIVLLIRILFVLKLQHLVVHSSFQIVFNSKRTSSNASFSEYSFFMGSIGERQTAIQIFHPNGKVLSFTKLAIGSSAVETLKKEKENYDWFADLSLDKVTMPKVFADERKDALKLSNVRMEAAKSQYDLGLPHINFLQNIAAISSKMSVDSLRSELTRRLRMASLNKRTSLALREVALQTLNSIDENLLLSCSPCHGDFTPWNCFIKQDELILIDFEFASKCQPKGYDLFHFIIQSELQKEGLDASQIIKKISTIYEETYTTRNSDFKVNLQLYIIDRLSLFITDYNKNDLSLFQRKEMQFWFNSLTLLAEESIPNNQQFFIEQLIEELKANKYAFLKLFDTDPMNLPIGSDLDIAIEKTGIAPLIENIKLIPGVLKIATEKQSFMTQVSVYFADRSYLSIDLISSLKRKHLTYLNVSDVLKGALNNRANLKVASLQDNLSYIYLFYTLNNATIPQRYKIHLLELGANAQHILLDAFKANYKISANSLEELLNQNLASKKILQKSLKMGTIQSIKNRLIYLYDSIKKLVVPSSLIISFSGVDGVGKSTTIETLTQLLETKYRKKVKVLKHRPRILPMLSSVKYGVKGAEKAAEARLPRMGKNKNKFYSTIKFLYYLTDYVIGQLYILLKYKARGITVLYDRYYFDFICDSKRSNLSMPAGLATWALNLVSKPKLNYFLYETPEVILKRKKELQASDITELTQNYQQLFQKLNQVEDKNVYTSIKNSDLAETMQIIENQIIKAA